MNKERKINLIFLLSLILIVFVILNGVSATDTNLTTVNNTGVLSNSVNVNDNGNQSSNDLLVQSDNYSNNYPETLSVADIKTVCNGSAQLKSSQQTLNNSNTSTNDNRLSSSISDKSNIYISPTGSSSAEGTISNPTNWETAYDNVDNGGTIYFLGGTYTNFYNKTITKDLTISNYNNQNVIIDGQSILACPVFFIDSGYTVLINGLSIKNFDDSPKIDYDSYIINNNGNLTLNKVIISNTNCYLSTIGNFAILTINNSEFSYNNGSSYSGVIYNVGSDYSQPAYLTINNSKFTYNTGFDGGVIYCKKGNVTLYNSEFLFNSAYNDGGVVYSYRTYSDGPKPNITAYNCSFINNTAINGSVIFIGGLHGGVYGNLKVYDSNFINNTASENGAIYNGNSNPLDDFIIQNSNFINNTALNNGGSIYAIINVIYISNSNFTKNNAIHGGAIFTLASQDSIISNCTFDNNNASYGGAFYAYGSFNFFELINSTFNNNTAIDGGVFYSENGSLEINNSKFENNQATSGGVAYLNDSNGDYYFCNDTFLNNNASTGGVVYSNNGTIKFSNSYLTLNNATSGGVIYNIGEVYCYNSTFLNNNATSGGVIYNTGNSYYYNSTFLNNYAKYGGVIYNYNQHANSAYLYTYNSTFKNNKASDGGVIWNYEDISDFNSTFINNTASKGGAIYNNYAITLNNSNFINNTALGDSEFSNGGAIFTDGFLNMNNVNFINNTAYDGGAIYSIDDYTLFYTNITNCSFSYNNASDEGGAIFYNGLGSFNVYNSSFTHNHAISGAAINSNGSAYVYNSTFSYNLADGFGAGIRNINNITVNMSYFINNHAKGFGGGFYSYGTSYVYNSYFYSNSAKYSGAVTNYNPGNMTLFNGTFINNTAEHGGALLNYGNANITYSNFINNTANLSNGGAIFNENYGSVNIAYSNFTFNNATESGGAIYAKNCNITSSTLINNTAKNGGAIRLLSDSEVNTCVIINNTASENGNDIYYSSSNTDLNYNWYGNNTPFTENNKLIYDSNQNTHITPSNWVILTATSNGDIVNTSLTHTNDGQNLPTNIIMPTRMSVYSSNNINPNPGDTNTLSTYSGVTGLKSSVTVDNETLEFNIAPVYYVNGSYTGESDGSINKPFHNITDAITAANLAGDGVEIYIMNGTYYDTNMSITNNLIISAFENANVTINAQKNGYMFYSADESKTLTIIGLTFVNGIGYINNVPQGGAIYSRGNVNIINSTFLNNTATRGGALNIYNVIINGSTFINNTASLYGGAIYGIGNCAMINSTFIDNNAYEGGAINSNHVYINYSTFINNTASLYGGAIFSGGYSNISYSCFINNTDSSNHTIYNKMAIDALYNWWGSNADPSTLVSNRVNVTKWVVMNLNLTDNLVTVSLNQYFDSENSSYNNLSNQIPNRIIIFNSSTGTLNPEINVTNESNMASSLYSSSNELYYINATVDNQVLNLTNANQTIINSTLTGDLTYGSNGTLTIILYDMNGQVLTGKTISYTDSNGINQTEITNSNGAVILNISSWNANTYTVYYSFNTTGKYLNSTNSTTFTINKQNPKFDTINVNNITYPNIEVVNITITGNNLTSKINVYLNGTLYDSVNIKDNAAQFNFTNLNVADYNAIFEYPEDSNHNAINSSIMNFTVNKQKPSFDAVIVNNITFGEVESVNTTINADNLINNVVNVYLNGILNSTTKIGETGVIQYNFTNLSAGDYNVTFEYTGDINHNISNSSTMNFTIYKQSPYFNSINIQNTTVGVNTIINGTLNDVYGKGIPNQIITIYDGSIELVNVTTDANGFFTYSLTYLTAGNHAIKIVYEGNENYSNIEVPENVIINKSATTISAEDLTLNYGESKTLIITLKDVNGNLLNDKMVIIKLNGQTYNLKTNNGISNLIISGLNTGTYTLEYSFDGDSNYLASNGTNTITVISKSTSIVNTELTSYVNGTVTVYVVDEDSIVDRGSVNLILNNSALGSAYVNNGEALINITGLNAGNYTVTVFYFGKDSFDSCSKILNLTVLNNPSENITINIPDIIVKPGINSTITINVSDNAGNTVSDGIITINIEGVNYIANVINGTAIVNYTAPNTIGLYNIIVTYSNGTYSTSVNGTINVTNMTIATVLIGNNLTKNYGVNANYTGKLVDVYGNPIAGQHIALNLTRLSDGKSKVYWVTTDTLGEYQLAINLSPGEYTVQASYYGNSNYTESIASVNSITVLNGNLTSTNLTADNFLEPFGAGLNFTGKLLDGLGNPVMGQHIALNLTRLDTGKSKVYWVTTDTFGEYQLAINLWTANYTVQCSYAGSSQYSSSSANATITVTSKI